MGWGGNFGANAGLPGISFGIDLNVSPQFGQNDFKLGISGGLKPLSMGPGGVELHADVGYATPFLEFNVYNVTKEQVDKLSEVFGLTVQQALNYIEYLKAASVPLKALLDENKTPKKDKSPKPYTNNNDKNSPSLNISKEKAKNKDEKNKESQKVKHNKTKTKKT